MLSCLFMQVYDYRHHASFFWAKPGQYRVFFCDASCRCWIKDEIKSSLVQSVTCVTFLHLVVLIDSFFINARFSSALSRGPSTGRQRGRLQKRPSITCSQLVLMPLIRALKGVTVVTTLPQQCTVKGFWLMVQDRDCQRTAASVSLSSLLGL